MPLDADGGRYASQIDLANENDSHVLMVRMVGGGKRVLDVGCWTGDMGAEFARFNPRVVGIEIDAEAAEQAKKILDDVVVADVTSLDFEERFGAGAFDAIVFGDVLEHVPDPVAVLRASQPALGEGGFVVASIPNVAHGSIRLRLLRGDFSYTDIGLLDRTHLRFFTIESLHELFGQAGLAVVELRRTTCDPLMAPEHPIDPATVDPTLVEALRGDPEALTYQFVVKAVRDDGDHAVAALYERAASFERRLVELEGGRPHRIARHANEVLRVGLVVPESAPSGVDFHHVGEVLEHEIVTRVHGPVDLRLLEGGAAVGPPGWGADLVFSLGGEPALTNRPHFLSLAVDARDLNAVEPAVDAVAAVGLLAGRLSTADERAAHVDLLRVTKRFPVVGPVATVVLGDEPASLVEELAKALSADDAFAGVVVLMSPASSLDVSRFEALWPGRCVVLPRPVAFGDLLACFAGSTAVVSGSSFDRAAAAAVDVRAAGTANPEALVIELDRSLAEAHVTGRAGIVLALDRVLDRAVAGIEPRTDDRVSEEVSRLHDVVSTLQRRLADERRLLADQYVEMRSELVAEETRRLRDDVAALSASLAVQRDAIVQLQDDCRAAVERLAPPVARRWFAARVRGRLRRFVRGA